MKNDSQRFQILSLDGGGIKGLFSAAVLAQLEEDCGTEITRHFDLITGTSTGGIIALALGIGMRPREIVQFYVNQGPRIFGNRLGFRSLTHWLRRKYSRTALETALRECFGDKLLSQSTKRLVIPSYNLGDDDVYIFKTPHHERLKRDHKVPLWKIALATSAAPTFFPCFRGLDHIRLIDGGVWANNPTMVGVVEACGMLNANLRDIHVFSIGTSDAVARRPGRLNWGGKLLWASTAVDVIMRGQSMAAFKQAGHLLGIDHVLRVDPKVSEGEFQLDRLNAEALLGMAAHWSRQYAPNFEAQFKAHVAAPFIPFHQASQAA